MLTSELIQQLQALIDARGDRQVLVYHDDESEEFTDIEISTFDHEELGPIYQIEVTRTMPTPADPGKDATDILTAAGLTTTNAQLDPTPNTAEETRA